MRSVEIFVSVSLLWKRICIHKQLQINVDNIFFALNGIPQKSRVRKGLKKAKLIVIAKQIRELFKKGRESSPLSNNNLVSG